MYLWRQTNVRGGGGGQVNGRGKKVERQRTSHMHTVKDHSPFRSHQSLYINGCCSDCQVIFHETKDNFSFRDNGHPTHAPTLHPQATIQSTHIHVRAASSIIIALQSTVRSSLHYKPASIHIGFRLKVQLLNSFQQNP